MFKEIFGFIGAMLMMFILMMVIIIAPIMYMDGRAKSAYIKQVQGIEIPWYQATFLNVYINDVNAKIGEKQ